MIAWNSRTADIGLGLLALVVAGGAFVAVTHNPAPAAAAAPATHPSATPSPSPTAAPTPTATASATPAPVAIGPVVVIGSHLAPAADQLAGLLDTDVVPAAAGKQTVIAAGALDAIPVTPAVVVLEVDPGTKTTPRTTDAIHDVLQHWPDTLVFVVGPFETGSSRTAQAVQAAAVSAGLTFLDPVAQAWGTEVAQHVATAITSAAPSP